MVEESHIRVDVRAATTATRDDLVMNNGNIVFIVVQGSVRLDDKREWELRLLENGVGVGNSVECRSNVFGGAIGVSRRCDT